MSVELRTERLILRPVRAADLDDLVEIHADRVTEEFFGAFGCEDVVNWIAQAQREWAERGRGLATEAARACLDWGFRELDVDYLTAMIAPRNAASIAVAGRLGMEPLREDLLIGAPVVVYAARA